jgi:hypothetical protein
MNIHTNFVQAHGACLGVTTSKNSAWLLSDTTGECVAVRAGILSASSEPVEFSTTTDNLSCWPWAHDTHTHARYASQWPAIGQAGHYPVMGPCGCMTGYIAAWLHAWPA